MSNNFSIEQRSLDIENSHWLQRVPHDKFTNIVVELSKQPILRLFRGTLTRYKRQKLLLFFQLCCRTAFYFKDIITTSKNRYDFHHAKLDYLYFSISLYHDVNENGTWNYLTVTIFFFFVCFRCRCLFIRFNIIFLIYLFISSLGFFHQRTEEITDCVF